MSPPPPGFFDDWLAARSGSPPDGDERRAWLLAPGARIGAWRVGGPLGRGGSCEVYHADGPAPAALRILHRTDPTAAERFRREVEILRGTDHPALPRLLDAGETPDGRPWMAVEELEKRELPRRDRDVARFVLALCGGLAHLHARGVVHRDVKPSNVLFRADGSPVLIDLGLVKRWTAPEGSEAAGPSAAPTLSIVDGRAVGVGTPGYAAPEQFAGGEVTPASDVYALGLIAAACFRGRAPRAWRAPLRRATSAIPAERPQTAEAFARMVRRRHAPAAAAAAIAALAAIAAVAVASFGTSRPKDPPLPDPPEPPEPRELSAARELVARLKAEAEPAWREVAEYSVYDGRPLVRVRLDGRNVALGRPLDLAAPQTVEIVGPGRLDATITGTPETLVTVRNAAVIDTTEDSDPAHSPRFRLGPGAFVSLPKVLAVFPEDFAETYDEPDPEHPTPGDRALRFSTAETSLGGQMALERECLAEAAARDAEEREIPAPWIGEATGWTNVVWTTGSAIPVRLAEANDGSLIFHVPGGIGQSWCRIRADNLPPFTVEYLPYFAGKALHGGRGGAFEQLSHGLLIDSDQEGGRPGGDVCSVSNKPYPGPQDIVYRFRSDLWAPPGHVCGLRFRIVPND